MLRTVEGHALSTVRYLKKKKDYISLLVWTERQTQQGESESVWLKLILRISHS